MAEPHVHERRRVALDLRDRGAARLVVGPVALGDVAAAAGELAATRDAPVEEQPLALQPAFLQRGGRPAQVVDPVDVDRAITFEVVGQQDVRRTVGELDHRHPRAHSLDCKRKPATQDLCEQAGVGRDVCARRVEVVELEKRIRFWRSRRSSQGARHPSSTDRQEGADVGLLRAGNGKHASGQLSIQVFQGRSLCRPVQRHRVAGPPGGEIV